MKLLIVTSWTRKYFVKGLYNPLIKAFSATHIELSREDLRNTKKSLKSLNLETYDTIILDLNIHKLWSARSLTRRYSNLIFREDDACQNFLQSSDLFGKFVEFYSMHKNCKVISSGFRTASALSMSGIHSFFIPKTVDTDLIYNEEVKRDIDCLFVGTISNPVYGNRERYINYMKKEIGMQIHRKIEYPNAYRSLLNRSKVFFSADVGLCEYMYKNTEAMRCGCAVVAFKQGWGEEEAFGVRDNENIILYQNMEDAVKKTKNLLKNKELLNKITTNGQILVNDNLNRKKASEQLLNIIHSILAKKQRNEKISALDY